jgi:DNA polymerase-4
MDAFFVSVELLRRPELRGRPVVVGGTGGRGVVSAASYEARRWGVHSAMSSAEARRLCPEAVFIHPDMAHYMEMSGRLHRLFLEFTPLVEQISVDEAFLDVTGAGRLLGPAHEVATAVRSRVLEVTGLGCSIGIAPNKFLAKLASEHAKPRARREGVDPGAGVHVVEPGGELAFLHPLPVRSMWGVGPVTMRKLEGLGVHTVGDLAALDEDIVVSLLGRGHGAHLWALAHGRDERSVEPERDAKSIGHEETFSADVTSSDELRAHLVRMCDAVARRIREAGMSAGTVMLKIRFSSFETITRSISPSVALTTGPSMVAALRPLLDPLDAGAGVRLLGVHAQNLAPAGPVALRLFADDGGAHVEDIEEQWGPASRAMDAVRARFGRDAIGPASAVDADRAPGDNPYGPAAEE